MIEIKGFKILSELYNGNSTIIYKAIEEKNNRPIVIKLLKSEYPTLEELKNFQYEFDIAKKLEDIQGIIKNINMIDYCNTKAIILEDFGADSIDKIIKSKKINLKSFLVIAIKAVTILGEIHRKKIIHKDIKPQNILLNPETGELKFIDFGISSQLTKEIQTNVNPDKLEGTLAYISPEQTGRMNRSVDYRTDYYSLGISFYEMLTKKLPFESEDPMELVHSHIAKIPKAPHLINQDIPKVLSNILMKLLEKTAEKRYQSAYGIRSDLEKCFTMLKEKGKISDFSIAQNDQSDKFQIPETIYGREKEIEYLMKSFYKAANGSKELIFFSGKSGIGKSVLINEVHKPMTEKKGYFISGKYDKFKKNIPYTAIIQGFQDLIKQIITENDENINNWKNKILKAVGDNGQVITNIIPALEILIGPQPEVQNLPPSEAQNRFNLVFQNFIKSFASNEHPLIIFLDDLQWADNASLSLLEIMMSDSELKHLLFIGAFRKNEIDNTHPFVYMQNRLKKSGLEWNEIKVEPLKENAINNLISDTLNCPASKVEQLTELIISKTGGTPFFVIEFLKSLYQDNLIYFKNGWKWELEKIKHSKITDNVIELMATKIQKLPNKTLAVMKVACCIGVKFYLDTLAIAHEQNKDDVLACLMPAINEGMIIKIEDDFKFVHDKVREATYSLIADIEQKELHYKIGKILLNSTKYAKSKDRLFNIVNQLNLAHELLAPDEIKVVTKLNMEAGIKAKLSAAYNAATIFFNHSISLLPKDKWTSQYDACLQIYTELAETEFLALNFEKANEMANLVLENGKSILDKVRAYIIKCSNFNFQKKYNESIEEGLKVLNKLGVAIPKKPGIVNILVEIIKLKVLLKKNKTNNLVKLPILNDKKLSNAMSIIAQLMTPTQISNKNLMTILILKAVAISIKNGNSPESSFMYSLYAYLMGAMGDLNTAAQFLKIGIKLGEVFNNKHYWGKAAYMDYAIGTSIKHSLKTFSKRFDKAESLLKDNGDFEFLSYLYLNYPRFFFHSGDNLKNIKDKLNEIKKVLTKLNIPTSIIGFSEGAQVISNLLGETNDVLNITGAFFDEEVQLPILKQTNEIQNIGFLYELKMYIYLIFNEYSLSLEYWNKLQGEYFQILAGQEAWFVSQFIHALTLTSLYNSKNKSKKKYTNRVKKRLNQLLSWSKTNPYNYKNKYLLIGAELSRITKRNITISILDTKNNSNLKKSMNAIQLYDLAIKESRENGFTQEEAIANECAAKYYLSIGSEKAAAAYMQEARYCYEKWGCIPKVEQLDQKYPDLLAGMQLRAGGGNMMAGTLKATTVSTASTSKVSTGPTTNFLDMGTIMKSSQTLAGEIEMKSLLTKMIKILIENAGAQKGLLILANDAGKLFIEAEGDVNKEDVAVLQSIPLDECLNLSPAIVRYVAKTKENVVLDNATTDSTYANDQYIKEQKPLSVICTPIINQGRLAAILYLENNLSPAAFTENRIEILNVLSTQAAISIENARLIEGMKEKERLKQEMEIAERIQTSLVPPAPKHDELDIAVCMEPAEEVGGDYYDVLYDQEEKLWFAIGDVTGHGVTPGLIMMMAATSFNTDVIGSKGKTPRDAMITVNQVLTQNVRKRLKETHFMTMSFMKYDEGGRFTYTGAHCDIVVFRKKTGKCDLYETKGIYLGIKADISKVTLDKEFDIDVDDIVVIYTDGVIESRHKDDRNKLMGMDILQDIIIENSNSDADTIMEAIKTAALEWCDYKPDDDITMVVAKRTK